MVNIMKCFIFFATTVLVVAAKPATILTPIISSISSQYHAQDTSGQYSYGYANGISSKSEVRTSDGVTRGGYSYIDAGGKLQSIEYIADPVNGFRATGTNIPLPVQPADHHQIIHIPDTPEVAEAKAKHLAAFEEAKARAAQPIFLSQTLAIPSGVVFQHVPATFAFRSNFLPAANSIAVSQFIPGFSYSYGVENGYIGQQIITPYADAAIVPDSGRAAHSPATPNDSHEVAKTKTEHPQAGENEKSEQEQH